MNNELKEILDNIKNKYEDYYVQDIVSGNDLKQLLDYITNLKQENARLKENNSNMQEEMARVWEENERLNLELSGYREAILRDDKLLGLQDYKMEVKKNE